MPYSNKQMLRDANGDLIPQYWDVVEQEFKPLTGSGGASDVRLTGSNVETLYSNSTVTVPLGARLEPFGTNSDIPNHLRSFSLLINTTNNNWLVRIRYSTGNNPANTRQRLEFVYRDEDLKTGFFEKEPRTVGESTYILRALPFMGTNWSVYIENNSDQDLELSLRIEGMNH